MTLYHDSWLYVEQTTISQDIPNNRSYVRMRVYTNSGSTATYVHYGVSHFDGDSVNIQWNAGESDKVLRDSYKWIYHNSDGTRTVNTSASISIQSYVDLSVNFSVNLPTIPRYPAYGYGTPYPENATGTTINIAIYTDNLCDYASIEVDDRGWTTYSGDFSGWKVLTISGFTPGTVHYFKTSIRRKDSQLALDSANFIGYTLNYPTVTSSSATYIYQTTAAGNGNVSSDGGSAITSRGICWGTSANPVKTGNNVNVSGTTGSFTGQITGLTAGTTYHFRSWATNAIGTVYGADTTFTTLQLPAVSSSAATVVLTTTVTANGNLTNNGNPVITEKGFCYGTSANPTTANSKVVVSGNATGVYSGSITGLSIATLYHYRAYAINSEGTVYGADTEFTTDVSYFTNPTNAYSSNNTYATAGSDSGVIAVRISKDGGTTWSAPKTNTFTSSEGYLTYGSATDTWGLSMSGADINSATLFLVKITSGTTNLHSQIYKAFGYAVTAGVAVMGLRVQIEAKYASSTISVDHIRVIPTISGTNADIIEGSTAYDSTLNTLTAFNGTTWDVMATLAMVGPLIYRVGDILSSSIATNPGETIANGGLGFGTWAAAGVGKVLVGKAASGTFATAGSTGGAETVTLTAAQSGLVGHNHTQNAHSHTMPYAAGGSGSYSLVQNTQATNYTTPGTQSVTATNNAVTAANATESHSNLPPYEVVYYWKRTA